MDSYVSYSQYGQFWLLSSNDSLEKPWLWDAHYAQDWSGASWENIYAPAN